MTGRAAMSKLFTLEIPTDHAAFAGHFPGQPIVPGVVLLDETLYLVSAALGVASHECTIVATKFLSAARPGEQLHLAIEQENEPRLSFTIRAPDRLVASGVLTLPTRTAGSHER